MDSIAGNDVSCRSPDHTNSRILEISPTNENQLQIDDSVNWRAPRLLYISHFLSTWNSRAFEFGAFLFLASIYPQTLLPASVYALFRAGSAAICSPRIGSYIDRTTRLDVVRNSIAGQRIAVFLSCIGLFAMVEFPSLRENEYAASICLGYLSTLAGIEKLYAIMNTISVERDWVVVIASDDEELLSAMNAQMRRIDLFCKLMAPLFISLMDAMSTRIAIVVTGGISLVSVLVEYSAISRAYEAVPALRQRKERTTSSIQARTSLWTHIRSATHSTLTYFQHPAFLPSFSLALLYLTVLSFNGQMITYLIAIGIPSSFIGVLRGISALSELSATWVAPQLMKHLGPLRSGIWFLNWQLLCVSLACFFFWLDSKPVIAITGIITAVVTSRIGVWGYDLSAQIIIQEEVEAELRGMFSSQEFAFQNVFEMLSFASTIVFPRPEQFKYPATISAAAVAMASVLYAAFVRARRGHLVHCYLEVCTLRHERSGMAKRQGAWQQVPQHEGRSEYELPELQTGTP